jgi:hypothetical protein
MAGALVKIGTQSFQSGDATLKITGINTDYNVYIVQARGLTPNGDDTIGWRVTKSGTIQTDSTYENARKDMPMNANFQNNSAVSASGATNAEVESTGPGFFATFTLFNFPVSEYSFGTYDHVTYASTPQGFGGAGGFVHKVASASDGISFYFTGGATFTAGELVLYGLKK